MSPFPSTKTTVSALRLCDVSHPQQSRRFTGLQMACTSWNCFIHSPMPHCCHSPESAHSPPTHSFIGIRTCKTNNFLRHVIVPARGLGLGLGLGHLLLARQQAVFELTLVGNFLLPL